jgi:serine/threonine protein kinase
VVIVVNQGRKAPAAPRVVGRYELREMLGEGGMGVVWRALDSKTGGEVAIKIMKDISDPAALELFTKEWKALAEMSHPNIVDVRDVDVLIDENEQKPFFVMPLLRGAPLSELIRNSSERLTVARVVEILSQVCRGLQAAHQRGLIHRDLKPSNIFVMDDDTAKIIDFGVVYLAGTHSMTGQKGTYQYMSPEQVQMKEVTPASDIFALGVILYEALTARKPFAYPTADETMQAVLKHTPPPVSDLNPGISHGISQVVHKCLAKQPIHRISSARELSETLQRALRNEPVFDISKLRLRIERAKSVFKQGDDGFASELLSELESEGHLDPEITVLRMQIDMAMKQKKIRQLMESARARIEQDEIPLGLDKLREVLELDPENPDALALKATTEKNRSEAQAGKWVELANTHLTNCDFTAARHAAQEALASRPGDPRALGLLSRIENIEIEANRVRDQKENLYNSAMRAYQNGEIDSALSRLARLFSVVRSRPEGAVPERDAVYESFYKEVRSEHDSVRSILEEAQHELSEENFAHALAICAEQIAKYPNNGAFQALKIQIEDAERQKMSAYIAMVSRNVDAEPDLDRRASILREACDRYPGEPQFAQHLKVVRERRDLVNSIVAKARQFGERGQYNEELSQWDILRNIHPRFPGLDFELEQCKKKRDQQAKDEEKAHLVEEIVGLMETRGFTKALERTKLALREFPGDTELVGLEKLSNEGRERREESDRLFEAGQAEASANNWAAASDLLRRSLQLDSRNAAAKDVLINVLTEQARNVLESDWAEAERLHQQAQTLDANHRSVRALGIEISEARRQTYVGECLTQARALVADGDSRGAYERIREGRKEYPKDIRLAQFEASLLKESKELQVRQERTKRLEQLGAARQYLERDPDSKKARNLLKLSRDLRSQDPDDPETMQRIAEAEQTVRRVMDTDDLSVLLRSNSEEIDATKIFSSKRGKEAAKQESQSLAPAKRPWAAQARDMLERLGSINTKTRNVILGVIGAIVVVIVAAVILMRSITPQRHTQSPSIVAVTKVHLSAAPADSTFKIDGVIPANGDIAIPADKIVLVQVSRLGYKTKTIQLDGKVKEQAITLEPLPIRISGTVGEKSGEIDLDGVKVGDLVAGSIDGVDVPVDGKSHTLLLTANGQRLATLDFTANPGERPHLNPIKGKDLVIVSSLGPGATIYGGEKLGNGAIGGTQVSLSNSGTDLPPISDQRNELSYAAGDETGTLTLAVTDWPSLTLRSLGVSSEILITSNVDSATLTANNVTVPRGRHGWRIAEPGTYNFVLSAANYETQTWTTVLRQRQTLSQDRKLEPTAVQSTLSTVDITGGTPAAEVWVDDSPVGRLDSNGAKQFADKLSAGRHTLQFRNAGYCNSRLIEVEANPPNEVHPPDIKLDPCGSITVQTGSVQARVKARHDGDPNAKWIDLASGLNMNMRAGTYDMVAESDGYKGVTGQIRVEAGANAVFAPRLLPVQVCKLQNPDDVSISGDLAKPKNGEHVVYLTPGCVNVNLTFLKPKGILARKRVEWVLEFGGGAGRITYELDNQKLVRKAFTIHPLDQKQIPVESLIKADSPQFDVHIRVDGSHIRVTNEKGEVLDDYLPQDPALHDPASGKLGLKTAAEFKFTGSGF